MRVFAPPLRLHRKNAVVHFWMQPSLVSPVEWVLDLDPAAALVWDDDCPLEAGILEVFAFARGVWVPVCDGEALADADADFPALEEAAAKEGNEGKAGNDGKDGSAGKDGNIFVNTGVMEGVGDLDDPNDGVADGDPTHAYLAILLYTASTTNKLVAEE